MIQMRKEGDTFLKQLFEVMPYNTIMAEIGCYQGESTSIFASFEKVYKIYAIDPWVNGYDNKDEASFQFPMSEVEKSFDDRTKNNSKIVKLKMKSEEAVQLFNNGTLDLVYIDGLHTYEGVKNDIIIWLPKVKEGLYIGGHDYLNPCGVKEAVNELFGQPDRVFGDSSWIKKKVKQ